MTASWNGTPFWSRGMSFDNFLGVSADAMHEETKKHGISISTDASKVCYCDEEMDSWGAYAAHLHDVSNRASVRAVIELIAAMADTEAAMGYGEVLFSELLREIPDDGT